VKKGLTYLLSLILAIGVLTGCGTTNEAPEMNNSTNNTETQEVNEDVIHVTISKDEGEEVLSEKEIAIEEGAILMDVLKENFDIEEDGGFVTSIDGVAPEEGEQVAWMYFVNDEMAMVGANEYELSPGDEVNFDLQAWE